MVDWRARPPAARLLEAAAKEPVVRPGWNATRRNRNIGTAKQGHGQDNRLVIPKGWPDDRVFWEVLRDPVAVHRTVGGSNLTFLVEPPRAGSFHACTVDDICYVLAFVPPEHINGIDLIVLRQPTRKQEVLRPVWGRLAYYAATGRYSGTAIYLEAQSGKPGKWSASLSPDDAAEMERLRADGHVITKEKRGHRIVHTPQSIRATQLHRTLLHELGHYVDWLESVVKPTRELEDEAEREHIIRAYRAKLHRVKEDFAHRYAADVVKRVPRLVAPMIDLNGMKADGLDAAWFQPGVGRHV